MSKSTTSKLTLSFVLDSVSYFVNSESTYFAKKGPEDTRTTRISRAAYEAAQAQHESAHVRSELASRLFELRFDMDCIGESDQLWAEIEALSDDEIRALIADYESEAELKVELPAPATVDATPAETVDPAPVDPMPATAPIMDATTRPDWAAMQSFERVTFEDLQSVPALVARGLGIAAMGTLKLAAMGIGALAGLGIMGMRKALARATR